MGGTGERRTLRLVAQYADARNLFDIPDGGATIRHKLQVLAEHCAAVGRAREEIETTVSTRFAPGQAPAAFIEHCAELAGLGVDHAVVLTSGAWTGASVEALAPVVTDLSTVPARDHRRLQRRPPGSSP